MSTNGRLHEGLLWYDPDKKKALTAKIGEAAAAYKRKHGQAPTHANVCDGTTGLVPTNSGAVIVSLSPLVQPDHVWIGRVEV